MFILSRVCSGISGILADEMGLGKTIQSISLVGYLKNFRNENGPHLVIVPKTTVNNWEVEFARFCPSVKVICLKGDKDARPVFIDKELMGSEWDVLITSYEMCIIEKAALKKFTWRYIIIDEVRFINIWMPHLAFLFEKLKHASDFLNFFVPTFSL